MMYVVNNIFKFLITENKNTEIITVRPTLESKSINETTLSPIITSPIHLTFYKTVRRGYTLFEYKLKGLE